MIAATRANADRDIGSGSVGGQRDLTDPDAGHGAGRLPTCPRLRDGLAS